MRRQWPADPRAAAAACRRGEHRASLLYPPGALRVRLGQREKQQRLRGVSCIYGCVDRGAADHCKAACRHPSPHRHRTDTTYPGFSPASGSSAPEVSRSVLAGPAPSLLQAQICRSMRLCRPPTSAPSGCRLPPAASRRRPCQPPRHAGGLCMHDAETLCPPGPSLLCMCSKKTLLVGRAVSTAACRIWSK